MPLYIDPARLEGQQLTLHMAAVDDYVVRIAGHAAGRIMARRVSGGRLVWMWSLTGPYIPSHLQPSHGDVDTLAEAKGAFRAKFDAWLEWATDLQHPVAWTE